MTGCTGASSGTAEIYSKPHLVDIATRTKEMMTKNPVGWLFGGAMTEMFDVVHNVPVIAVAGHNFKSAENVLWSDGKPFTGLQVVVQGGAFAKGIVGQPFRVTVISRSEPGKEIISQSSGPFVMTSPNVYTATITDINCDKLVEVDFEMSAYKEGEGDYQVLVGPIDNSAPPVSFMHCVSVSGLSSKYPETSPKAKKKNSTK
jgi:hypothetical protein